MSDVIVKSFIEEIMDRCVDKEIDSGEVPSIITKMLLEVQDESSIDEIFDEITENCSIDPYGDTETHKLDILEHVLNEVTIYSAEQLKNITYKYQDVGYDYYEAEERAKQTEYMKQLKTIENVLTEMVDEAGNEI